MLMNFDNGTFLCHDYQVLMFEQLKDFHPTAYADILNEVEAVKASHPQYVRNVDVSILGEFEKNSCRRVLKSMDDFNKFNSFEVQNYTTTGTTVQNTEWITDSIVVHANF